MANQGLPPIRAAAEIIWPDDIMEVLIEQRRRHQTQFSKQTRHNRLWTRIANHIHNHYQFNVTARQCQVKFYALKKGYENLKRLLSDDPDADGSAVRSPVQHDRLFFNNLSDEFWICKGNYIFSKNDYVTIEYLLITIYLFLL